MNNLAFQIYGTKKATPFKSVWDTRNTSPLGGELANITASAPATNWGLAPGGTSLSAGGYAHTAGSTNALLFNNSVIPGVGQSHQIEYTITGTGSVVINFGGISTASLTAGTNVIITLTTIASIRLSINPSNDFAGTISLSLKSSSSATNQIQLPISVASGKSIWIDWGDNSYTNVNSANQITGRLHTYSIPGEYAVRILGDNFNFRFSPGIINDRLKIKSISSWGKLKIESSSFYGCANVTMSGITDIPDLTGVTDLTGVFWDCREVTTIGRINEWNTSSLINASELFRSCHKFNSDISNWNVSNVTNMTRMLFDARAFNQPLAGWERSTPGNVSTTSKVTSMNGIFSDARVFNQPIGNWDVSNVTTFEGTFRYAYAFNQNLSSWNVTKSTYFYQMFQGATAFNNGYASGDGIGNQLPWTINTSPTASVIMGNMFQGASAFNSNLGTGTTPWNVSQVTSFANMFQGATNFNNGDEADITKSKINNWNIGGSVTGEISMSSMFSDALKFNRDISSWNVSKVNNMSSMFLNADAFNQPLANWERNTSGNVSTLANVTNMYNMFRGVLLFDQNIGNWNVSKVTTFAQMFQDTSAFNNGGSPDIDDWDINTTPGANVLMNGMFSTTGSFNQPLNGWNTSEVITMSSMFGSSVFNNGLSQGVAGTLVWSTGKVTTMAGMFSYNPAFNQDISSWNVSNVTTMASMFTRAFKFNQPIGNWERVLSPDTSTLANVTTMGGMFQEATVFNQSIGNWNVNKVVDFASMFDASIYFSGSAFNNGLLPGVSGTLAWNINTTAASVSMSRMFNGAWAFNQNINSWNVSKVTNMLFMFRQATLFNQPLNSWDVSSVTSMSNMFNDANAFDKDISSWNVGKVTDMSYMFASSNSSTTNVFNNGSNLDNNSVTGLQGINGWNINTTAASVTMQNMFDANPAFNRNIGSWNVSKVTNFSNFMNGKTPATFSSTNLDAIYNGWIVNGVKPNTTSPLSTNITFGTAKYSQAGKLGRDTLLASPNNWRITDGGNENALTLDAGNPLSYPGTGTLWTDLSGNNNNGTLVNGPTFDSANGGSIVFDGNDDYANIINPSILQSQNFSISVWINPSAATNVITSLIDFDHASTLRQGWVIQSSDATTDRYYYLAYWDGTAFQPSIGAPGMGVQTTNFIWQNLTYIKNGTSVIGYLNGVQLYTATTSNATVSYLPNRNLAIGKVISTTVGNRSYNGKVSTTQIYNRALSAIDVLANFDATKGRYGL